jgi:hypothetical protein
MVKLRVRRLSLTGASKENTSKAADDLLDTDLNFHHSSARSFASSMTSPPSQSGSFYRTLKQQQEDESKLPHQLDPGGEDWVSDYNTDDDDKSTRSRSSWGGFTTQDANGSDSDNGLDNSVKSSPVISPRQVRKKKKKGKRRLKDFFRRTAQNNQPITEEDEEEAEGIERKEGSKAAKGAEVAHTDDQDSIPSRQSRSSQRSLKAAYSNSTGATYKGKKPQRQGSMNNSKHSNKTSSSGAKEKQKPKQKQKLKRRNSLGALRRLSMGGGKTEETEQSAPPPQQPSRPSVGRRHSMGGGNDGGVTSNGRPAMSRRSSLGSMLGGGRRNSLGEKSKTKKGPVIPDNYHSVIHRERDARDMYLYERSIILDTLAQGIANDLAAGRPPTPCDFYGNIGKGHSLKVIHSTIMEERKGISRKNILSNRFNEFGMGLAIGGDKGKSIFMCTLFK